MQNLWTNYILYNNDLATNDSDRARIDDDGSVQQKDMPFSKKNQYFNENLFVLLLKLL